MSWTRTLVLACALALCAAVPAAGQTALPPSLTVDTAFAPPEGIARDGGVSGTDIPGGAAVDGDRIYVVGESDSMVAVIARKTNGSYDTGFGDGGRVEIDLGTGKDVGAGILVLPDGRLRILAATDVDTTPGSDNMDIAVIGLEKDGTDDASFGGGDGRVSFPIGVIDDTPSRFIAGDGDRLAIAGWRKDANGKEDTFVARLNADGTPDSAFGVEGIKVYDRAGNNVNDRGIDLAWRGDGGLIVLHQVATNPDTNVNDYAAALHALDATGADDPSFSEDADLVLSVGEPNTIPGALLAYDGRYWVTGSTKVGTDTDAFLFRVQSDGSGAASRRFDMRGKQIDPTAAVVSGGGDLTVLPGAVPTLVVVGSTTYSQRTLWSAAAFNEFGGDLAAAGFGDLLVPTEEYGALLGVVAGDGWLATVGSLLNVQGNFDTSFGTLRLLVDADKKCDLTLAIPAPLEATLVPGGGAGLTVKVSNNGTKACAGDVAVAAPFRLRRSGVFGPLPTTVLGPGGEFSSGGGELTYAGPLQREADALFKVTAPGDSDASNDSARLHVLFSYCDASLAAIGSPGLVPTEGTRRFDFELRSRGTTACRGAQVVGGAGVRAGAASGRSVVAAGRSISDELRAAPARVGKPGARVTLGFHLRADGDAAPLNNDVRFAGTFIGVGDSDIRRMGSRVVSGRARGGPKPATARQRRLLRVEVAVQQRVGKRCRWLASARGVLRSRGCANPTWVTARGKGSWRLALARRLPRGRYVVTSRAVIGAGFPEASFSRRDRTRLSLRVR